MKIIEVITEEVDDVLYHVTRTTSVPSILKKGINLLQTTNWVEAGNKKRFGTGEIYAFDNPTDAQRWAGKMDWEFFQELGSGKISIVEFTKDNPKWEQDNNDPMSQFGKKGNWLKSNDGIPANQIIKAYPFTQVMARALVNQL
jgi:hypothetical protein